MTLNTIFSVAFKILIRDKTATNLEGVKLMLCWRDEGYTRMR